MKVICIDDLLISAWFYKLFDIVGCDFFCLQVFFFYYPVFFCGCCAVAESGAFLFAELLLLDTTFAGKYFPIPVLVVFNTGAGFEYHIPLPSSSYMLADFFFSSSSRFFSSASSSSRALKGLTNTSVLNILISCVGRSPASVGTDSITRKVSIPPTTLPKTVCLLFNHGADLYVIKLHILLVNRNYQLLSEYKK